MGGAARPGTRSDQGGPLLAACPFEEQATASFNACEWGQIRRSTDTTGGGRIVQLRAAIACQTIFVRPDSPITHPQALRHKTIAVNFHASSHPLTLQLLEGFMAREDINVG